MSSLDWEWLKQSCMSWIKDKCNDVVAIDNLAKLKDKAEAKGFTRKQVSKSIHRCREIINEVNASNKQPTVGAPEKELPATKEPTQESQKTGGSAKQKLCRDIQNRAVKEGLTPSGTRKEIKYSGPSILDMADEKRNA